MTLQEFEEECLQLLAGIVEPSARASIVEGLTGELFVLRTSTLCIKRKVGIWSGTATWTIWLGDVSKGVAGNGDTLHDAHLEFQVQVQTHLRKALLSVEPLMQASSALLKNALNIRAQKALKDAVLELKTAQDLAIRQYTDSEGSSMAFDEKQVPEIRALVDQRLEELGLVSRYSTVGATTGRISCKEPNHANPPRSGVDTDDLVEQYNPPELRRYETKQSPAVGNGVVAAAPVDPDYDPSCDTCGGAGELMCPRCCTDSVSMCALCAGSGIVFCRCGSELAKEKKQPRYALMGVNLHRSYNGSMLPTGIAVKAVAYTAEEAEALTTVELLDECGGTALWIDLTTGQAAMDV